MAVTLGDALVFIRGDRSGLGKDLDGAEKQTRGWASKLGGAVKGMVGNVMVTAAVTAGSAIVGVGAAALKVATDTQQAQRNLQAELGVTEGEAKRLGEVALQVFGNNFADSVQDAAGVLADARRQLGAMADDELQQVTESAFKLADVFGVDTSESLNAVSALMDEFGLTSQEAFDFVTTGFQKGLNNSDDFLDSIGEYSNLFADAEFGADEFFSIMETGAKAGVLGTDKIADAVKEFNIRIMDGSDASAEALKKVFTEVDDLSVVFDEFTGAEIMEQAIQKLNEMDDPLERAQLATALFGTTAEDLGISFTEGLSMASTSMEEMAGATDGLAVKYGSLGDVISAGKRKALVAIKPIGDMLLGIATKAMPHVIKGMEWFSAQLPKIMATAERALQGLMAWIGEMLPVAIDYLGNLWETVLLPALRTLAEFVIGVVIPTLMDVWGFIQGSLIPIFMQLVETLISVLKPVAEEVFGFLMEMVGLVVAWVLENWPLIQQTVETVMTAIQTVIQTVLAAIVAFWNAHGAAIMSAVTTAWNVIQTVIETVIQAVLGIIKAAMQAINGDWAGAWETIRGVAATVWEAIKNIIAMAWPVIKNAISVGLGVLKTIWSVAWTAIKTKLGEIWDAIPGLVTTALGVLKTAINNGLKMAKGIVTFLMDSIKTKIKSVWDSVPGLFEAGVNKAKAVLKAAVGAFKAVGGAIVAAIKEGISAAWGEMMGWFDNQLQKLKDKLPLSEPKAPSPLRNLGRAGEAYVENILAGAMRAMPRLQEALAGVLPGAGALAGAAGGAGVTNEWNVVVHAGAISGEDALVENVRMLQLLTGGA